MTVRRSDYWVVGVDPSLTATGVVTADYADTILHGPCTPDLELSRLRTIVGAVASAAKGADLVVLEGLALASTTGKAAERGALHWMIRDRLDRECVPVAVVPPACLKRYITGKGNAGKAAVLIACVQRLPILVSNEDEADAAVLLAMGLDHVGAPLVPMPAHHRAALGGVSWPDLSPPARYTELVAAMDEAEDRRHDHLEREAKP
jgi:crossover junction endodeoxyribonuclease RuvC